MKILALVITMLALNANIVWGQTPQSGTRLEWNPETINLSQAIAYRYNLAIDNVWQPTTLISTCSGTVAPFICTATIPLMDPEVHTLKIRKVDLTTPTVPAFSDDSNEVLYLRPPPKAPTGLFVKK